MLSLLWAWGVDGTVPDHFDVIGALVILAGIGIMYQRTTRSAGGRSLTLRARPVFDIWYATRQPV